MKTLPQTKLPKRSDALKLYVQDLGKPPVKRYAEVQKARGRLITIGKIDVDIDSLVERTFLCDRHRCIQWTPHEKKADAKPLIDNSCCSRYTVPVTDLDRDRIEEILPLVKKRLPKNHPYNKSDDPPYELQDDFSFALRETEKGTCQFVVYDGGHTACAIHKTCLEEGLSPWVYKPLGCSMWPLAILDYEDDQGNQRLMLTIYSAETEQLFDNESDDGPSEDQFACMVDKNPKYEPMYQACRGVIEQAFGPEFYKTLEKQAQQHLARG